MLRTRLTDALAGDDATAGREHLNHALEAWAARVPVEEELGEDDLPGVEVIAGDLPPVPLQRWHQARTDIPTTARGRCSNPTTRSGSVRARPRAATGRS